MQAYLRTPEGDAGTVIDYRNWQLSLGRRFRSLKLWFVLRSYGIEGFQKHISSVSPSSFFTDKLMGTGNRTSKRTIHYNREIRDLRKRYSQVIDFSRLPP
jgi:glutamate/tyrosine decarboxylase-like PLP-dependent enzyme